MTMKTQYEKDMAYIEKIDRLVSKRVEFLAYFVVLMACLAAHVMYFVLFALSGIKEMTIFNVGSILFYGVIIILINHVKEKVNLVYAALTEIIIHATFATVFVGLKPNFAMFLLMVIPIAFLMPNKKKYMPFVIMGISMLLYMVLNFLNHGFASLQYDFEDDIWTTIFSIINVAAGIFVLTYVTCIYTLTNLYQESKLRVQNEQLKIMASVDPLTRLSNRRAMGEELKRIGSESDKSGKTYVVGLGDIDSFKKVNDTYGHEYGDLVLSEVANVIRESLQGTGRVARWGGEEFLFVMENASLQEAVEKAEGIVRTVRQHEFQKEEKTFYVTMTFGVSEGQGLDGIDAAIRTADQFLYFGKNHGKNQVMSNLQRH